MQQNGQLIDAHRQRLQQWRFASHRACLQVLLLAGPGVVIGTALTAVFVKYVFPYDWSWVQSLLFGAMLSATDPVAVIALLQEVCVCCCSMADHVGLFALLQRVESAAAVKQTMWVCLHIC